MRKSLAAAIAAGLLLSACTDDGSEVGFEDLPSESPSAEPTETASAEAPSDEIDVTTTPDEITPEWVTAVVNTLLAEYGEMTAEILAMPVQEDPTLPDGFDERLAELFEGEYLERRREALVGYMTDADARSDLRAPADFDGLAFTTQLVQVSEPSCVVAVGRITQVGTKVGGEALPWLSAVSLSPSETPNPTSWVLVDELPNTAPDGALNPDEVMLEASLDDYGASLGTSCVGQG